MSWLPQYGWWAAELTPRETDVLRLVARGVSERREAVMDALERLRGLCLALPETTERLSHGEPTWFVRDKKTFVMFADHHHDDRLAFWCAAAPETQAMLVGAAP